MCISKGLNWVSSQYTSYGGVPPNAVHAGRDIDGAAIYVGRAYHNGDLIPSKVIPSRNVAYIPYGGEEIAKHDFEILSGTGFTWVGTASGHIPPEAVCAGNQSNGEPLYVGRASVGRSIMTGKVQASHGCIYVPFDGSEHSIHQYEVLIRSRRSEWVSSSIHSSLPEGAVCAGHDIDGSPIFIGRAWHGGDQLLAKVIPSKRAAYVAYYGAEISKDHYEVLCHGSHIWIKVFPTIRAVPPFSVQAGVTSTGEPLYIGRAHHQGSLTVGKMHIPHGALYIIPFDGREVPIHTEIKVLTEP